MHHLIGDDKIRDDKIKPAPAARSTGSRTRGKATTAAQTSTSEHEQHEFPSILRLSNWANRAGLNFTHILRLDKQVPLSTILDTDLLVELWLRHAAAQGIVNQPGWDLLIPVYMSDDTNNGLPNNDSTFDRTKLTYIAIQVKNCVARPKAEVREGPVGPRLELGQPNECLELFIDLRGTYVPTLGHTYYERRHPILKKNETLDDKEARDHLFRHHIYISGHEKETFPEIETLPSTIMDQVALLFGCADSVDTVEFDNKLAQYARRGNLQDALAEAMTRIDGAVVHVGATTNPTTG